MTSRIRRHHTGPSFAVTLPHDPAEVQAERGADAVSRGENIGGWSFAQVPPSAAIHRDGPTDKPQVREGTAGDIVKALAETPVGKQVIEKVKERPDVKAVLTALDTPGGKVAAVGAGVAGLAGLAAAKQPLPAPIPAIPVGTIGGYAATAKLTIEGPVNAPTFVGVTLSFSGTSSSSAAPSRDAKNADTARLRADLDRFRSKDARDAEATWVRDYVVAQQSRRFAATLLPLRTGEQPKTVGPAAAGPAQQSAPQPAQQDQPGDPKKEEEDTVQRDSDPAYEPAAGRLTADVHQAVDQGGRPLEDATRRSMEARFGRDFSDVRIHDHAAARAAATGLAARAFTLGPDVGFDAGRYQPWTAQGRRLIAHELVHVVQQRASRTQGGR